MPENLKYFQRQVLVIWMILYVVFKIVENTKSHAACSHSCFKCEACTYRANLLGVLKNHITCIQTLRFEMFPKTTFGISNEFVCEFCIWNLYIPKGKFWKFNCFKCKVCTLGALKNHIYCNLTYTMFWSFKIFCLWILLQNFPIFWEFEEPLLLNTCIWNLTVRKGKFWYFQCFKCKECTVVTRSTF